MLEQEQNNNKVGSHLQGCADGDTVESIGTYEVASMLDRDKNVGDLEYLCSPSESLKVNHVEEEIPLGCLALTTLLM
jgi:hypothetical protein